MADSALLCVYGGVVFFFILRFAIRRKVPSLWLACLPLGWILVALWSLGILHPLPYGTFRWLGVFIGLSLLASLIALELKELRERKAKQTKKGGPE